MMLLWEHSTMTVKELGEYLYLDSGTLTPLLKKLESKGFITRTRSKQDERNLNVTITDAGRELHDRAMHIAFAMGKNNLLTMEETIVLYRLLYKMLGKENVELPDWAE
jgi:DNA-binding MarR family transcriptional regulator